ncbi:MAG: three-Cys-motif partner protein TcmP [Opitutaceae bacterium]
MSFEFDEIGPWSEVKLDILRKYAGPYSRILKSHGFHHGYIDAFSGPGLHIRKEDKQEVLGSPLVALSVEPAFDEYHLIDLDGEKVQFLRDRVGTRDDVSFYTGDSNRILQQSILPRFSYEKRSRALCLLDPYKLTLDWSVVMQAGKSRAVEVFINFPVMHMNRNCKKQHPREILPGELAAMDSFWGDRSWHTAMFRNTGQMDMFGGTDLAKQENADLVSAYCSRLQSVAGFGFVAEPLPMPNSKGAIVYYLIFAGPNATGSKIVKDIYRDYR